MVLYPGEKELLVIPLCPGSTRYCPPDGGLRVRPLSSMWHMRLEGKKMDHNAALQMQASLWQDSLIQSCTFGAQVWTGVELW